MTHADYLWLPHFSFLFLFVLSLFSSLFLQVLEMSRSDIAQEKSNGFSFASIAAMTGSQVKQYYIALKLQVNKAERQLQIPVTVWSAASNFVGTTTHGNNSINNAHSNNNDSDSAP